MRLRVYLRVAKSNREPGYRVLASAKPNYKPLYAAEGTFREMALPTAAFALDLDIPDEEFERAEQVLAEILVEHIEPAVEVTVAE